MRTCCLPSFFARQRLLNSPMLPRPRLHSYREPRYRLPQKQCAFGCTKALRLCSLVVPPRTQRYHGTLLGRFSGAQPLGTRPEAAASGAAEAQAAEVKLTPGDLDSELLQHLRRLSKRDPVTKLKALQARPPSPVSLLGSSRSLL